MVQSGSKGIVVAVFEDMRKSLTWDNRLEAELDILINHSYAMNTVEIDFRILEKDSILTPTTFPRIINGTAESRLVFAPAL